MGADTLGHPGQSCQITPPGGSIRHLSVPYVSSNDTQSTVSPYTTSGSSATSKGPNSGGTSLQDPSQMNFHHQSYMLSDGSKNPHHPHILPSHIRPSDLIKVGSPTLQQQHMSYLNGISSLHLSRVPSVPNGINTVSILDDWANSGQHGTNRLNNTPSGFEMAKMINGHDMVMLGSCAPDRCLMESQTCGASYNHTQQEPGSNTTSNF